MTDCRQDLDFHFHTGAELLQRFVERHLILLTEAAEECLIKALVHSLLDTDHIRYRQIVGKTTVCHCHSDRFPIHGLQFTHFLPKYGDGSRIRFYQPQNRFDGGGLAGSILSDDADHIALLYTE